MLDKPKRKHDTHTLFKLKLMLIAFIIGTLIATFFPMVWLAPPLFAFTPFVYIGLSLLWIPIVWHVLHRITWDRAVKGLMIGCFISSMVMMLAFEQGVSPSSGCYESDSPISESFTCWVGESETNTCRETFGVLPFGNLFIAQRNPWNKSGVFIFCLF